MRRRPLRSKIEGVGRIGAAYAIERSVCFRL